MKRALLSLLCGIAFVVGYFIVVITLHLVFQINLQTVALLLNPLNLPYGIYKKIFGLYEGNQTVLLIGNQVCNVLIYSAIFYFIFAQYANFKKKNEIKGVEVPPPPPNFESKKENADF
jgi:hypothetical protein